MRDWHGTCATKFTLLMCEQPTPSLIWYDVGLAPIKRPFSKLSLSLYLLPFGQPGASATRLWQQHRPGSNLFPCRRDVGPSSANGPRSDVTHLPKRAPKWVDRTWSNVEGFQGNIVGGKDYKIHQRSPCFKLWRRTKAKKHSSFRTLMRRIHAFELIGFRILTVETSAFQPHKVHFLGG